MYGATQGSLKMSESLTPSLMPVAGAKLREVWDGIRTFVTGGYTDEIKGGKADIEELEGIVVAGTERGSLVTYDVTNYLNDTNFNENAQVMYEYDSKGREKAAFTYGETDQKETEELALVDLLLLLESMFSEWWNGKSKTDLLKRV